MADTFIFAEHMCAYTYTHTHKIKKIRVKKGKKTKLIHKNVVSFLAPFAIYGRMVI